jgi:2-succinyl-5-enolpyruvyl-6-hydroxy-3-cyclohexene-1-carboxylate synthase
MLDFSNINTLWSSIVVETLKRLGLKTAIICPGSRSSPLAIAFAQDTEIQAIPILDERSAVFFALGMAKKSGLPVALVCTSGTAGANFYPGVIEAKYSRVPLLILTGDRPPELRDCHAGQTVDQVKFYGNYPNWQVELSAPLDNWEMLCYLRQTLIQSWERSLFPAPGPVHLNFPFRDPLTPTPQPLNNNLETQLQTDSFFSEINPITNSLLPPQLPIDKKLIQRWKNCPQGIIIAGLAQSNQPWDYCRAISRLAELLEWPVLGEGLSPLRNYAGLNRNLIATYDLILRNESIGEKLAPLMVIQLGELPTSKQLRTWLNTHQPQRWIIDPNFDNFDPLHHNSIHLRTTIEQLSENLPIPNKANQLFTPSNYLETWLNLEAKVQLNIDQTMTEINYFFEGKVAWLLSQKLPAATPIFIANSMPVRYVEFFWKPRNSGIIPLFNRGTNGIDGTLSTALGMAYNHQQGSVLLTGDLAFLHDTNGLLIRNQFQGHLTIILINNNGGGIFEMLPIAQFDPPFEDFFATPQHIDFQELSKTYGIEYIKIADWEQLISLLNPLPEQGIRVLEITTNRKKDALWLQNQLPKLAMFEDV